MINDPSGTPPEADKPLMRVPPIRAGFPRGPAGAGSPLCFDKQIKEDRRQRAEDRIQTTEDRKRKDYHENTPVEPLQRRTSPPEADKPLKRVPPIRRDFHRAGEKMKARKRTEELINDN